MPYNSDEYNSSCTRWGMIGNKFEFVFDETEITVGEWLNYAHYSSKGELIFKNDIAKHLKPDSTVLTKLPYSSLFEPSSKKKLRRIASLNGNVFIPIDSTLETKTYIRLTNLPIAGITYKQVQGFIEWRNKLEAERFIKKGPLEFFDYQLPTREQLDAINAPIDSINKKGISKYNYKNAVIKKKKSPYQEVGKGMVEPWLSSLANKGKNEPDLYKGFDHIRGNVAEMLKTQGESYGGSFAHYAIYSDSIINYTLPKEWLGFRCVGIPIKR